MTFKNVHTQSSFLLGNCAAVRGHIRIFLLT